MKRILSKLITTDQMQCFESKETKEKRSTRTIFSGVEILQIEVNRFRAKCRGNGDIKFEQFLQLKENGFVHLNLQDDLTFLLEGDASLRNEFGKFGTGQRLNVANYSIFTRH